MAAGMVAWSCVALAYVVAMAVPSTSTTEVVSKSAPVIVTVTGAVEMGDFAGASAVSLGAGAPVAESPAWPSFLDASVLVPPPSVRRGAAGFSCYCSAQERSPRWWRSGRVRH
jgi:hypothetical protein